MGVMDRQKRNPNGLIRVIFYQILQKKQTKVFDSIRLQGKTKYVGLKKKSVTGSIHRSFFKKSKEHIYGIHQF